MYYMTKQKIHKIELEKDGRSSCIWIRLQMVTNWSIGSTTKDVDGASKKLLGHKQNHIYLYER